MALAVEVEAEARPLSDRGRAAQFVTSAPVGLPNIVRVYRWIADELAAEGVAHIPVDTEFGDIHRLVPDRTPETFMEEGRRFRQRAEGTYDASAIEKALARWALP